MFRKVALTNPRSIPFSLSNDFEDAILLKEDIEEAESAEEVAAIANRHCFIKSRKWYVAKETSRYVRLESSDALGNIQYLIAYKEVKS